MTLNETQTILLPDEEQLEFAASLGRTILSYNARDFVPLHYEFLAKQKSRAEIIICE